MDGNTGTQQEGRTEDDSDVLFLKTDDFYCLHNKEK